MEFLKESIFNKKAFDNIIKNRNKLLIFDYDGTLAPFVKEREKAFMYNGLADIINSLNKYFRIYFVSGRSVYSLKKLLEVLDFSPCIWGSHGNEVLRSDGIYQNFASDKYDLLENLWNYFNFEDLKEHTEKKISSVAVHYRGISEKTKERIECLKDNVRQFFSDIEINCFDGGYEFKIPSFNKGFAVRNIMSENQGIFPLYFGDDLTDEDAFKEILDNGAGFLVREEFRETEAHFWIKDHEELKNILKVFLEEGECQKEDL